MSSVTIKTTISVFLITIFIGTPVSMLAADSPTSETVGFPKPDLDAWRHLQEQRTKEELELVEKTRANALSAFLYEDSAASKQDESLIRKDLRLDAIAVGFEDSVAVVGQVPDERYEKDVRHFLVQFKGGYRGKGFRFEKVFEKQLPPQQGTSMTYRLQHVSARHWPKPLVYLFRDDEGSHFRTATHELYGIEGNGLRLLWTWKDEYAAWTNFDQKRGYSISNIDFSGLASDNSDIVVFTTEGVEHSGKKPQFRKTRFVWDGKKNFRQVDGT